MDIKNGSRLSDYWYGLNSKTGILSPTQNLQVHFQISASWGKKVPSHSQVVSKCVLLELSVWVTLVFVIHPPTIYHPDVWASKNPGPFFGSPFHRDYSTLGSIVEAFFMEATMSYAGSEASHEYSFRAIDHEQKARSLKKISYQAWVNRRQSAYLFDSAHAATTRDGDCGLRGGSRRSRPSDVAFFVFVLALAATQRVIRVVFEKSRVLAFRDKG